MPRLSLSSALVLGVLAGCSAPQATEGTDTDASGSSTSVSPTTGDISDTDAAGTTTDAIPDPTTTGATTELAETDTTAGEPPSGARVLYLPGGAEPGLAASVRAIDITDAIGDPITLVTAPEGGLLHTDLTFSASRRWAAIRGAATDQTGRLWLVDLAAPALGPAPAAALPADVRSIGAGAFSPDAQRFGFQGLLQGGVGRLYLCAIEADGACTAEEWSPPIPAMSPGVRSAPAFAADGAQIAYAGDLAGDGTLQLVLAASEVPGEATALASYPSSTELLALAFAPEGGALYFTIDQGAGHESFAVDLSQEPAKAPVALHPADATARADFAPDLRALLVWTGETKHGDLSWISLAGASAGEAAPIGEPGHVRQGSVGWSPDGQRLLLLADHAQPGTDELYVVDVSGDAPAAAVRLSAPLGPEGTVSRAAFAPDGARVVYYARPEGQGDELFLAALATPGEALRLSAPLPKGASLPQSHRIAGERLLYRGPQDEIGVNELYAVDLAEPGPPAKVNAPLPPGGNVGASYDLAPDGQRAFFLAPGAGGDAALFAADLAGAAPGAPQELSEPGEDVATLLVLPMP